MQRYQRPPEPIGFTENVHQIRLKIERAILNAENLPREAPGKREKKSQNFPKKWSEYKPIFARAQFGKCAYCEINVISGQPGDVEHFCPKGEVWEFLPDEDSWGVEREWSSSVEGRFHKVVSKIGYWWLAYDWSNYLLSCQACNQNWKGAFFPVLESPRTVPPERAIAETPLLLNPFNDCDPIEHLHFSDLGQIEAKNGSCYGYETIRTCGLDRENLRRSREEKAKRAYRLAFELSTTSDQGKIDKILFDFHEMGHESTVHSGMVRAIFEDLCGITWEELEDILRPSATP